MYHLYTRATIVSASKEYRWVLSHVQLFATPWTIACQAPLSMGILQGRMLRWVAMPSSRGSSWLRDSTLYSLCNVLIFLCLWKFSLLSTLLYLILTYAFILLFSKYPCHYWVSWAFLVAQTVRNPPALWRPGFNPWVGKIPWRRTWESVFLPGEFSG